MKNAITKMIVHSIFPAAVLMLAFMCEKAAAQGVTRWVQVGSLQNWYSGVGSEMEEGNARDALEQQYGLRWPASVYRSDCQAAKGLWIGAANFTDASGTPWNPKVINVGPRLNGENMFFTQSFNVYGRFAPTQVYVNGKPSTASMEILDALSDTLRSDRLVVNIVKTSLGITMQRKIYAFSQQYHDNYHIMEYTFTNTGNSDIGLPARRLTGVMFYWQFRYASGGPGPGYEVNNSARWGINAMNDARGYAPDIANALIPSSENNLKCQFTWLGFHNAANKPPLGSSPNASMFDNIGAPIFDPKIGNGYLQAGDTTWRLGAAQIEGNAPIYADKSATDPTDDTGEPTTTSFVASDDPFTQNDTGIQYNQSLMSTQYAKMTEGHAPRHAWLVQPSGNFSQQTIMGNIGSGSPGGWTEGMGYGPYTLEPDQSVRIIWAEGVSGLTNEECVKFGKMYKDGVIDTKSKNDSVLNGRLRLFETLHRAIANYKSGFAIPQPPFPPAAFSVNGGLGNRIALTWTPNANESANGFLGYRIYRATGAVDSLYHLIYQCGGAEPTDPNVKYDVNKTYAFDDVTACTGVFYFYYITAFASPIAADPVTRTPAGTLESSRYYTQTNDPASPFLTPTNLTAIAGDMNVTLEWNKDPDAITTRYRVYMGTSPGPTSVVDSTVNASETMKVINGLVNNTTYYFRVTAIDGNFDESAFSNEVACSPYPPPVAPTDLAALAGNRQVKLTWSPSPSTNVLKYYIYCGPATGPTTLVDSTTSSTETTRIETGLTNGTTYYFRIKGIDSTYRQGPFSNEVWAVPFAGLKAPTNLWVVTGSQEVKVGWTASMSINVLKYYIYCGTTSGPTSVIDSTAGSVETSRIVGGLTNNQTYYIRVASVDSTFTVGPFSNEVSCTPSQSANNQYQFVRVFPDSFTIRGWPYAINNGIAVDPAGKIWIQSFAWSSGVDSIGSVKTGVIRVFNPDGSQPSFSPIKILTGLDQYGVPVCDTLNANGYGLATDPSTGNILSAKWNTRLWKIDYRTGQGIRRIQNPIPGYSTSIVTPMADQLGEVFIAPVLNSGNAVVMLKPDFTFGGTVTNAVPGLGRCIAVSADGKDVYVPRFDLQKTYLFHSDNGTTGPYALKDSIMLGLDVESMAWHPKTGILWASSGNVLSGLPQQPYLAYRWYGYNVSTKSVVDSIVWNGPITSDPRPRGIAFSPTGDTVYVAEFGSLAVPSVQMFVRGGVVAQPPPPPTLGWPANGGIIQPTSPALTWNASSGASGYRLQISTSPTFATLTIDSTCIGTSVQVGPLAVASTYYWRVYARNVNGPSSWSSTWSFTIATNNSALFDGATSSIGVSDGQQMNPSANPSAYKITGKAITVEAWVYPMGHTGDLAGSSIVHRPLARDADDPGSYRLFVSHVGGIAKAAFSISDGTRSNVVTVAATDALSSYQWTHLAGTYDGSTLKLYVNGQLKNQLPTSISIGQGGVGFYIGRLSGQSFEGLIDDVRLWNITKGQSEILSSMNEELLGSESGLVGNWRMDAVTSGNLMSDATSNQNDLVIQSAQIVPCCHSTTPIAPSHTVTPGSIDFGTMEQGYPSTRTLSVTNNGTVPLVGVIDCAANNPQVNSIVLVPAGQTANILLNATSTSVGYVSDQLSIGIFGGYIQQIPLSMRCIGPKRFDANSIAMFTMRDGRFAQPTFQQSSGGFEWPKGGGKTAIYEAGIWIGATVGGNVRSATAWYWTDFAPGPILNGVPANQNDTTYRVYKIQTGDSALTNPDYATWPSSLGAPINPDGTPKIIGGQTLFSVSNDLGTNSRHFGTLPLGAEVQQTIFGSNQSDARGNTVFVRFKIINKSSSTWNNTYVALWSDPDLGNYADDLVGVDTVRSMGFVYNGSNTDAVYGTPPPALGYRMLQGAFFTKPIQSFAYFTIGTAYPKTDPNSPSQVYNFLQGRWADGSPYTDPGGQTTTFPLSGDPVTGSGWNDSNPFDRRIVLSTGPFDLEPNQSKEIITAIVVGKGTSNLNSISVVRALADSIRLLYDAGQIFGGTLENVATTSVSPGSAGTVNDLAHSGAQIAVTAGSGGATVEAASYVGPPPGAQVVTSPSVASVGKYLSVQVQGSLTWPASLRIYYMMNDLLQAGIVESDLQGLYYWSGATNTWKLYSNSGADDEGRGPSTTWVDTTNVTINGVSYEGFVAASAYHLTPIAVGAKKRTIAQRYAEAIQYIQSLPTGDFKNPGDNRRSQLADMFAQSQSKYTSGNLKAAAQYLSQNVTNHLTPNGKNSQDVWVTDETARLKILRMLNDLLDILQRPQVSGTQSADGSVVLAVEDIPTEYGLSQNYPNPFNPSTTIRYQIPQAAQVSLKVYNTVGQEVAVLVSEFQNPGFYQVQFTPQLPSGVYIYRLQAGAYVQTRKLVLLK